MQRLILVVTLVLGSVAAHAEENNMLQAMANHREVLTMGLYPPQIVMRQQQQLGITDRQRKSIAKLVSDFQGRMTELQWEMPNEQQKLREILRTYPVDSEEAVKQAQTVTNLESTFKLANFELLIAIKNELTEEQVDMLNRGIRERLESYRERSGR